MSTLKRNRRSWTLLAWIAALSLAMLDGRRATALSGDIFIDGAIDDQDLASLTDHVLRGGVLTGQSLINADLNGDGAVDVADLVTLARIPKLVPRTPVVDPPTSPTTSTTIQLTGTADAGSTVRVEGATLPASTTALPDRTFAVTVTLGVNRINRLFVFSTNALGGSSSPAVVEVIHDAQDPFLFIDFPPDGLFVENSEVPIVGRVGDMLSGFMGLGVSVNGGAANVHVGIGSNGTFERVPVPLAIGANTITAIATDVLGNSVTKQITLTRVAVQGPRMVVLSGNGQTAMMHGILPAPLRVKLTHEDGTPFADKLVNFKVIKSDARLSADLAFTTPGSLLLQVRTDTQGEAIAFLRLGSDAGMGNNRVEVTSEDIAGTTFFCASATPAPADRILVGLGNNQLVETGAPASQDPRIWVNDGCNGVPNVPVTFKISNGGGKINDASGDTVTVMTGPTGHASIDFKMGDFIGVNTIEATFPGNTGPPAVFTLMGVGRSALSPTTFGGVVQDNTDRPIGGVECILQVGTTTYPTVYTDAQGRFLVTGIEGGLGHIHLDAGTATTLGGQPIPVGSFPAIAAEVTIIPNVANTMPMPARMPMLNPANARLYDGTSDIELSVEGIEGLKMTVRAGSMRNHDGSEPTPADPAILTLNQVHFDEIPMPLPDGAAPPFAWTLQPAGASFDPPVEITMPNMSGLPAGAVMYFLSFNHDTNRFEIVSQGHVTDDGASMVSDPGSGIPIAGWGGNCPPYPITKEEKKKDCRPTANGCGNSFQQDYAGGRLWDLIIMPNLDVIDFMPACNNHDRCYGSPSTGPVHQQQCDLQMLIEMRNICVAQYPGGGLFQNICLANARVFYYELVDAIGSFAYASAQKELADCLASGGTLTPPPVLQYKGLPGPIPFPDADGDLMDDDWETLHGLNPASPDDRYEDPDGDGMTNYQEFHTNIYDPQDPDTDNDSVNDLDEQIAAQPPPQLTLDNTFTVTLAGQTVPVREYGYFTVPNISVPDANLDGISDQCYRITGISTFGSVTRYAESDFFLITNAPDPQIPEIRISYTPPLNLESMTVAPGLSVLTTLGQTTPIEITALMSDGTISDVISLPGGWAGCTSFISSNADIVSVSPTGLATAEGPGTAFITVTVQGVTSVTRLTVSPGDPLTVVEGIVQDLAGNPIQGAAVTVLGFGLNANTAADGKFTINNVPTLLGLIAVRAQAMVGPDLLAAFASALTPIPDGITDAGILILGDTTGDQDGDCLPDAVEVAIGLDPNDSDSNNNSISDGDEDTDGDGLSNCLEALLGTNLTDDDSDGDGLLDGAEYSGGTNPFDPDSDDDGFPDTELSEGSDPNDPTSRPINDATAFASILNVLNPGALSGEANGPALMIRNITTPAGLAGEAVGPAVTVLNTVPPPAQLGAIESDAVSVENQAP